jgi:hypothetical protein
MPNSDEDLARLYNAKAKAKKIGLGRRIAAFFIDFGLLIGVYCLIFFLAATPIIKNVSAMAIGDINATYALHCEGHGYPYYTNEANFGFYEMDDGKYVADLRSNDPSLTEEEAYDEYFDAYNGLVSEVKADAAYVTAYSEFQKWYLFFDMLSYLIPAMAFELAVPLLNKDRKTVSGFLLGASRVNTSDDRPVKGYKILIRFGVIFLVELFGFKVLLNYWSLLVIPLANLIMILAIPSRITLSGLCSASRLVETRLVNRAPYPSKAERLLEKERQRKINEKRLKELEKERHQGGR